MKYKICMRLKHFLIRLNGNPGALLACLDTPLGIVHIVKLEVFSIRPSMGSRVSIRKKLNMVNLFNLID